MKLSKWMDLAKKSAVEVAADAGVSRAAVYAWKRGTVPRPPLMEVLTRITDGAVTANDFVGRA